MSAAFTCDGIKLAVSNADGGLQLLDIVSGKKEYLIERLADRIDEQFAERGRSKHWRFLQMELCSPRVAPTADCCFGTCVRCKQPRYFPPRVSQLPLLCRPTAVYWRPPWVTQRSGYGATDPRRELSSLRSASLLDALAFSSDGQTLISGNRLGVVKAWNPSNSDSRRVLGNLPGEVTDVAFLQNRIVAAGPDAVVGWELQTHQEVLRQSASNPLAISPSGNWLAGTDSEGHFQLVEMSTGKRKTLTANDMQFHSAQFSPDSRILAAGGRDVGVMRLWDVDSGQLIHDFGEHFYRIVDMVFPRWSPARVGRIRTGPGVGPDRLQVDQ